MATLTFLRIGKEIHDELETFLSDHLMQMQSRGLKKLGWNLRKTSRLIFSIILKWSGFGNLI